MDPVTLEADRLVLRAFTSADVKAMHEACQDERGNPVPISLNEHASRLSACVTGIGEEPFIPVVDLCPEGSFPDLVGRQLSCNRLAVP